MSITESWDISQMVTRIYSSSYSQFFSHSQIDTNVKTRMEDVNRDAAILSDHSIVFVIKATNCPRIKELAMVITTE